MGDEKRGMNTEVELNRRRWKSIGRSTSNNSHATSIVATCSVVRSYKISLRGRASRRRRKRKVRRKAGRNGEGGKMVKEGKEGNGKRERR